MLNALDKIRINLYSLIGFFGWIGFLARNINILPIRLAGATLSHPLEDADFKGLALPVFGRAHAERRGHLLDHHKGLV